LFELVEWSARRGHGSIDFPCRWGGGTMVLLTV
jgi:hypothetical protein